jgi:hypothetical protein
MGRNGTEEQYIYDELLQVACDYSYPVYSHWVQSLLLHTEFP